MVYRLPKMTFQLPNLQYQILGHVFFSFLIEINVTPKAGEIDSTNAV